MGVAVDADAELLGCGGQGHKGIPGFGPVGRAWSKADVALAYTLAGAEFGGVIVQRDFWVVEHHQQAGPLEPGLLDALIQGPVTRDGAEQDIEFGRQSLFLGQSGCEAVSQQLVVVLPKPLAELVQLCAMLGEDTAPASCSGGPREPNTTPVPR
jgi:hypothetical protein